MAGRGGFGQPDNGDFTTVQRYDVPVVPTLTAQDDFFEFLFSGSDMKYAQLKELATNQEPIPPVALKGVKLTINVDAATPWSARSSPETSSASFLEPTPD